MAKVIDLTEVPLSPRGLGWLALGLLVFALVALAVVAVARMVWSRLGVREVAEA